MKDVEFGKNLIIYNIETVRKHLCRIVFITIQGNAALERNLITKAFKDPSPSLYTLEERWGTSDPRHTQIDSIRTTTIDRITSIYRQASRRQLTP